MKKHLFLALILFSAFSLSSCSMKDKNGNSPLIENENGKLVDNPDYKTDEQYEYDDKMYNARQKYKNSIKDDGTGQLLSTSVPSESDREEFGKRFKSKTSKTSVTVSGKDKTTIKLTASFNTELTAEQYDNLHYFDEFKRLGFKKVILSNGKKNVYTREL